MNPNELVQLYILLSHEKLQRATISQRHRPTEASLRDRLLVWRFLKKIENEPSPTVNILDELNSKSNDQFNSDISLDENTNDNSWFLDINTNFDDDDFELDMDIESDLGNLVENSNDLSNNFLCDTTNIDQTSDVNYFLKRAIGAERKRKTSSDNHYFNGSKHFDCSHISETNLFDESEQNFHDLCAELFSPPSTSTSNSFHFSSTPEQTVMH